MLTVVVVGLHVCGLNGGADHELGGSGSARFMTSEGMEAGQSCWGKQGRP